MAKGPVSAGARRAGGRCSRRLDGKQWSRRLRVLCLRVAHSGRNSVGKRGAPLLHPVDKQPVSVDKPA